MNPPKKWIRAAVNQAKKSKYSYRLGAIAIKGRAIIASGTNQTFHGGLSDEWGFFSIHAEAAALKQIEEADTLVVVRILANNSLAHSKPCKICMDYIRSKGVKKVFYINKEGQFEKLQMNKV